MNIKEETMFILDKYNIRANKGLGQNFLINEEVIEKIIEAGDIKEDELVIEIGPGIGTLTKFLIEKAKKVICIELDTKMINILNDRFKFYDNIDIVYGDILKVDISKIIKEEKEKQDIKKVKVIANLPYYITTPIIMKLLEEKLELDSIIVMIQKEVADRLVAIPGSRETGAITYTVYYYTEGEKILEVPNSSFIPEPEVTSEVIKLNIRSKPYVDVQNEEVLFRIIKCAFMQRRKNLLNALTNTKVFLNKEEGIKILNRLNIDLNSRAENLKLEDYANITHEILKKDIK